MHSIDLFVQNYFSLIRAPFVTETMYLLSTLFDVSLSFVLISVCFAVLIYIIRNIKYSILFLLSLLSGGVIVYFLKLFFNVSRPTDSVMVAFGQSFPSYHATIATIFFVILMYIFDDYLPHPPRIVFNLTCATFIFLVSFSRVYLGVHWVSDVAFGILLGFLISYISITIFKYCNVSQKKTSMLE